MNWRGRPLTDIELIGSTTAQTGLTVAASYDPTWYERGVHISNDQMAQIPLKTHNGEWNYTITPPRRVAPKPVADPNSPALCCSSAWGVR